MAQCYFAYWEKMPSSQEDYQMATHGMKAYPTNCCSKHTSFFIPLSSSFSCIFCSGPESQEQDVQTEGEGCPVAVMGDERPRLQQRSAGYQ